jgi:FixJ family two-component response regulator
LDVWGSEQLVSHERTIESVDPVSAPRAKRRTKAEHARARRLPVSATKPGSVIIVEDDRTVLNALATLVRSMGFKVRTFDRPSTLLEKRMPSNNACLLIDIYLPEMNGIELCERLAESGQALPTIFITGRKDEPTQRLVRDSRAIAVLFKPIDERPLLETITRAIARSRPHQR